jgi:hypothetical protein
VVLCSQNFYRSATMSPRPPNRRIPFSPANFQSLTNCPRLATLSVPLSFQRVTTINFCNSFLLITIRIARGGGIPFTSCRPQLSLEQNQHLRQTKDGVPGRISSFAFRVSKSRATCRSRRINTCAKPRRGAARISSFAFRVSNHELLAGLAESTLMQNQGGVLAEFRVSLFEFPAGRSL